jgi:hypothetical protein
MSVFSCRDPDSPRARVGVSRVFQNSFISTPRELGLMPRLPGNSWAPCANELVLNNDFEVRLRTLRRKCGRWLPN